MTPSQLTELSHLLDLDIVEVGVCDPLGDEWPTSWCLYLAPNANDEHTLYSTPLSPRILRCLTCLNKWRRDLFDFEERADDSPEITPDQRQHIASLLPLLP